MNTRKSLLASLHARLARFANDQDVDAILSKEAVDEVQALLAASPPDVFNDLEALGTAGYLHWYRYLVLPPGGDQEDLFAALMFFTPVYLADSDAVPDAVRETLDKASPDGSSPEAMADRAERLLRRPLEADDPDALDEAVDLLRQTAAATPDDHPNRAKYLAALDGALERRFELKGVQSDLDEAVEVSRQAVAAVPPGHSDLVAALSNLGNALGIRFECAHDSADLEEAVKVGLQAMAASSADHLARADILSNLGANLLARFMCDGTDRDLDQAIDVLQQAADITPRDHPGRAGVLSNLGNAFGTRFERGHDPADLGEAIKLDREAMALVPEGHLKLSGLRTNLSTALRSRFECAHDPADLEEAIKLGRQAVAATPPGHSNRDVILSGLSNALHVRFKLTGILTDLDEAIELQRRVVAATSGSHPSRADRQSYLSEILRTRFESAGHLDDLDEAIEMGRQALAAAPPGLVGLMSDLGTTLQIRFGRTGDPTDLDEAIDRYWQAMAAAPNKGRIRALISSNLSAALLTRYDRSGDSADLDEAIKTGRHATSDHPGRASALSNLANALRRSFERYGRLNDLNEAIRVSRAAVATAPAEEPDYVVSLSNLAGILQRRYEWAGELAFLDEAIETYREALEAKPGQPHHTICLANLGIALLTRFERTRDPADLEKAIEADRRALAATPDDHVDRARRLTSLGNALRTRFQHGGTPGDLDESVDMGQQALAVMPPDHADRARYLANLGNSLLRRSERTENSTDLDEAVENYRQAAATTPADHPRYTTFLIDLAVALRMRFARTGKATDLNETIEICKEAADVATAPPSMRANAARLWGRSAADRENWAEAAPGYAAAVELLASVAPRSLGRSDQEYWLAELAGVGTQAAACHLQVGQRGRAVELWEQGRGVLLAQALDTRADLTLLRKQHADLADEFIRICEELDHISDIGEPTAVRREIDRRHQLAREHDQIIAKIRSQQGFDRFLLAPTIEQLLSAANQGPIVLLNVSDIRSDALLLTPAGVKVVPLPGLAPAVVADQVARFMNALDIRKSPLGDLDLAERTLLDVLRWLWEALAGPVLNRLDIIEPIDGDADARHPRVWWCPSGLLAYLPLHAAGDHSTRFDPVPQTVLDRVVSSYTPTIRALVHARRADTVGGSTERGRLLVVAMPHTPGETSLWEAVDEAIALRALAPSQVTILHGELLPGEAVRLATTDDARAEFESVRKALPRFRWAHFACHAVSDMTRPSASHLLLADHQSHPLTVVDLTRFRLAHAELAFLSACSTARIGRPGLADEAIHLSAAFQLAGYRHVIATLWPIDDKPAMHIATEFYTRLASGHVLPTTADAAAQILHTVIRQYRDSLGARSPWMWAAHLHSGSGRAL